MTPPKPDYIGIAILTTLFLLLTYASYLSYKSIDWTILKRLETTKLVLPTPIPATPSTPSAATASPSAKPNL